MSNNNTAAHAEYTIYVYTDVDIVLLLALPISIYTATATAANRDNISPNKLPLLDAESENAMSRLPDKIKAITKTSFGERVPFMNNQYPNATHITSVQTIAVELATEV